MSILPILTFPNSLLRKKAKPIKIIDNELKDLIVNMTDTLKQAQGVGLAANQVGVLKRLCIIKSSPDEDYKAYINPEIIKKTGTRFVNEGCLSFPEYNGIVKRSISITARYLDETGGKIKITADELLSQALEHEIDHLNGILFIDHLKEHEKLVKNGIDDGHHNHDVNYSVNVEDNIKKEKFDSKLYTKTGIDDLNLALEKADILKEVKGK
ncbi:MAG: peptide deformylase [Chloroflexota bacterium]|jgi:peptide deformylase|nr:peptide deformylase [Chloroflexota bacterium]MEC8713100.1 peptide deformylase [Chloroflexota bacterium]|tara:strand:+ start:347 stop:979 length:633 start_codon:yes stop_codon:yes gene_type:complete